MGKRKADEKKSIEQSVELKTEVESSRQSYRPQVKTKLPRNVTQGRSGELRHPLINDEALATLLAAVKK